ncbi:DNA/RNA helicase domain-containing protein [Priestia megaterium]|uniref:DNA/RNA helicase domain-containing protein n=1 Tax=Priestia megaterium TaxID=1404 RepID=UPI00398FA3EA
MIIYVSNAIEFRNAVDANEITTNIEKAFKEKTGLYPGSSEKTSWNNSMQFMERIIRNSGVADDCGIFIEFNIPNTRMRVDFIVAGLDKKGNKNFVIIELKQWSSANATEKKDVITYVGGGNKQVAHPSYQAWSYKEHLINLNEGIHTNNLNGYSCAYLHNYIERELEPLKEEQYSDYLEESPIFFSNDYKKLQEHVFNFVGEGDGMDILHTIATGKIRPSQKLIDHVTGLFKGNQEFVLLDEQKVAYETIMSLVTKQETKKTIIVKGGPGTGKSVISMNSLGTLLNRGFNAKFIAPNASFREVMLERLIKENPMDRARIKGLFSGSGQYYNCKSNSFEVLLIDEAHRLKRKDAFQYKGENQVEDMIKTAQTSIFFIDDTQRIRPEDIGSVGEIKRVAAQYDSEVHEVELKAQFRCAGADGFINWTKDVLQIEETGNFNGWDKQAFEFKVLDTPQEVYATVKEKNDVGYNARMLAGYAWDWTSQKQGNGNGEINDVKIPEHHFSMPWNARSLSTTWAIKEDGINQIGCVHTSQGLEFDYVGIIIGNDLKYDNASGYLYADYSEYKDKMGKRGLKNDNEQLTELVKNVYKTLLSRGMKGCYVYCRDKKLEAYFKRRLTHISGS